jgi:hypothetical protein
MATSVRSEEIERFNSSIRLREISPELILVDPELARVARAALPLPGESRAAPDTAPAVVEVASSEAPPAPLYYALDPPRTTVPIRRPRPTSGRWDGVLAGASKLVSVSVSVILFASLLVNLALAGALLGGGDAPEFAPPPPVASMQPASNRSQQEPRTQPQVGRVTATTATHRQTSRAHPRRSNRRAVTKAAAERTVLGLLQTAPRSRIRGLVDPKSGLLKNNVSAVCRRHGTSARFLCVARYVGAPRGAGLYVRYTSGHGGRWSVTWLGYRHRSP